MILNKDKILSDYRLNPSDSNFRNVYDGYYELIERIVNFIINKYRFSFNEKDYLINEGFVSIVKSCRSYIYQCKFCDNRYLYNKRLNQHCKKEHKVLGECYKYSLKNFVECGLNLHIRKIANKIVNSYEEHNKIVNNSNLIYHIDYNFYSENNLINKIDFKNCVSKLSIKNFNIIKQIVDTDKKYNLNNIELRRFIKQNFYLSE